MNHLMDRRSMLVAGGMGLATALTSVSALADPPVVAPGRGSIRLDRQAINVVDLTMELTPTSISSPDRLVLDPVVGSGYCAGMNMNRLLLVEHTGTHIDAPRHFDKTGKSLGEIPIEDLVVPLAIMDISGRVAENPDTALTPDDVLAWEEKWGRLPAGCCVALRTGFDMIDRVHAMQAGGPRLDFSKAPGFDVEVCEMLIRERDVKGIAIDTGGIDRGKNAPGAGTTGDESHCASAASRSVYPVHQLWLRSGRWGIEFLTNMQAVPPSGAILVVGAAPIRDATGIPIRAIALF